MNEIKRINISGIDFPNYCFFFIKEIVDSLKEYDITNVGDELTIEIDTANHPYCYDAIEVVVKTFKRKGFGLTFPSFFTIFEDGEKLYRYKWKLTKLPPIPQEDLPF